MARSLILAASIGITLLAAGPIARAATPAAGANYLQTAPLYDFGATPFSQVVSPSPLLSAGPGAANSSGATSSVTAGISNYAKNIHGYVSAGVATHGGMDLEAGADLPLVPGRADLAISGGTSQIGGLPHPAGTKGVLEDKGYQATLHLHPADGLDAYIAVSQDNLKLR